MPRWDYQCPKCKNVFEFTAQSQAELRQMTNTICVRCGVRLDWLPSAPPAFKIEGYNAKNGYSK